MHCIVLPFHILLNRSLVQFLVGMRVFRVNIDLIISEHNTFGRVFVENNVKRDLLGFCDCEEIMLLHLLPTYSGLRVVLHCLVEEIEAL